MPDKLVTRGLVLRATETKEADYILTVLTALSLLLYLAITKSEDIKL